MGDRTDKLMQENKTVLFAFEEAIGQCFQNFYQLIRSRKEMYRVCIDRNPMNMNIASNRNNVELQSGKTQVATKKENVQKVDDRHVITKYN